MDTEIILTYCVCDDYLKSINYLESSDLIMSHAEVLTHAIIAAMFFHGNHEKTRLFLQEYGYIPNILSKSQLNRRIRIFDDYIWRGLLHRLAVIFQNFENTNEYVVDSFPVAVCDTPRILRCKIYQDKKYHGYSSSKQRYFYGIKVHAITSIKGFPQEVLFTPGSENDVRAFKRFNFNIQHNSVIYADRAYNDYEFEDFLLDNQQIRLIAQRKRNSKRPLRAEWKYIQSMMRKRIETAFSQIINLFPKSINAVTSFGFELKVFSFIVAFALKLLFKHSGALA